LLFIRFIVWHIPDFTTDGPEDRTYDYKKVVTTQTISVAAYDFTGEQNE
jgi:hypothetical protein